MHVHMTGRGGEAGPASRCPEAQFRTVSCDCIVVCGGHRSKAQGLHWMQLSDFLDSGITTAVGVLGTDTVTRTQVCTIITSDLQLAATQQRDLIDKALFDVIEQT